MPDASGVRASQRAAVLVRFRDKQVADCLSTVLAALLAWGVGLSVNGTEGLFPLWRVLVLLLLMVGLALALMLSGLFGDRASYRAAVPLTDPHATTSSRRETLRCCGPRFAVVFVIEAAIYTALGLLVEEAVGVIVLFAIIPGVRFLWVAWWERRHGLWLWETWEGAVRQARRPVTHKNKEPQYVLYTTRPPTRQ